MKKRNPLGVVGLSLVTFGIYDIYWLAKTRKVLNEQTKIKVPTIWLLITPLVLIVIFSLIMFVNVIANFGSTVGLIVIWVMWIAFTVISIVWFLKYSKAVDEYTNGKMSTVVSFLVLYLIHLIGVALIQDAFNNIIDDRTANVSGQPVPVTLATSAQMPTLPQYQQPIPTEQSPYVQPTVQPQPVNPEQPQATSGYPQTTQTPLPVLPPLISDQNIPQV